MALQVIGAGWGRTGTDSLKVALETLLGAPCYHMKELMKPANYRRHVALWQAAADGEEVDWNALFKGYVAAVDLPASCLYKDLMKRYPNAKVHWAFLPCRTRTRLLFFCDSLQLHCV